MADLSKIKLNGTVYNFKDNVARNQIHLAIGNNLGSDSTWENTTSEEIYNWLNNNEIVIVCDGSNYYYLQQYENETAYFQSLTGETCFVDAGRPVFSNNQWITMADLPIYDGTVE